MNIFLLYILLPFLIMALFGFIGLSIDQAITYFMEG
jgi:hypothetical protein